MLVKYLGCIEENGVSKPRFSATEDGLFRVTQPKFLNDRGSECRVFPYFNEFSPADYEWAKKKLNQNSTSNTDSVSDEFLASTFLKPLVQRYGDSFPHLVQSQTNYEHIGEYDESVFHSTVRHLNHNFVELISTLLGVISFSRTLTSEYMWIHYANEGRGIAFTFHEEDEFFTMNGLKEVSYEPRDRACFTYYKGMMRLNGMPLNSIKDSLNVNSPSLFFDVIFNKEIDFIDFTNRLIFSKSHETWKQEEESRLLFMLSNCDQFHGREWKPEVEESILKRMPPTFPLVEHEIVLKKIPFSAFESVVLGENVSLDNQEEIIRSVRDNPELDHVKIKKMKYDIYGKLIAEELDSYKHFK